MRTVSRWAILFLLVASFAAPALAQANRDPLTDKEVDQLRETAQEPEKRMHLLVSFAQARMEMIDHLRTDQNMANAQADKIGSLLDDVASIVDEIDDNLSMYNERGEDLRKSLREIIETDSDFQLKLRTIKETSTADQLKRYGVSIETANDSVNSSADSARAMLDDQNAKKGKEKPDKKEEKSAKKEKPSKPPKAKKDKPDYTGMGGLGKPPNN